MHFAETEVTSIDWREIQPLADQRRKQCCFHEECEVDKDMQSLGTCPSPERLLSLDQTPCASVGLPRTGLSER